MCHRVCVMGVCIGWCDPLYCVTGNLSRRNFQGRNQDFIKLRGLALYRMTVLYWIDHRGGPKTDTLIFYLPPFLPHPPLQVLPSLPHTGRDSYGHTTGPCWRRKWYCECVVSSQLWVSSQAEQALLVNLMGDFFSACQYMTHFIYIYMCPALYIL